MKIPFFNNELYLSDLAWDGWCITSVIGIWPRFIEPNLIYTKKIQLKIKNLPPALAGLKIVQFSDIHFNDRVPDYFLKKLTHKMNALAPDLIVFTGDFLCYSELKDNERLVQFLNCIHSPLGCFAIFGNHDYAKPVSINSKGEYDIVENHSSMIGKGFSRIFSKTQLAKKVTSAAKETSTHHKLEELLKKTPFQLLHNSTRLISFKGSYLNLCGLGEYTLGKCQPDIAFKNYDPKYPGIILSHNPDSVPMLLNYPGEVILCGHTHGGQVNLPWLWKKFTLLENMQFKKGLFHLTGNQNLDKWLYVNPGIGSVMKFRWFAMPEITCMTLE